jgi:hypothetical protein
MQGKPDQHVTHIPCLVCVCPSTICISRDSRITTFHESSTELDRCTALKKKCSRLHLSARLSGPRDRLGFSPNTTIEAVRLRQASIDDMLLGLLGSYHQYAISTFHTCSRRPTHRSLIDTRGGYNLGGVGLLHHTPRPSQ